MFSFRRMDADLFLIEKTYVTQSDSHGSDISGPYWMLIKVTAQKDQVWYYSDGQKIFPGKSNFCVFIPPYSWTTEYYNGNTTFQVRGLISKAKLETDVQQPIIFESGSLDFPNKIADVSTFIKQRRKSQIISLCSKPSSLSVRAKNLLDRQFHSGITLEEIALKLRTSSAVLSRSFKKNFGHPLSFYKKGLRVTVGMYELMMGNDPIRAAELSGYNDLGRFFKQFKQYLKQTPSTYSNKSKNAKKRKKI